MRSLGLRLVLDLRGWTNVPVSDAAPVESLAFLELQARGCVSTVALIRNTEWLALGSGVFGFALVCCGLWMLSRRWIRWPWMQWVVLIAAMPLTTLFFLAATRGVVIAELDRLPPVMLQKILDHPAFLARPEICEACRTIVFLQEALRRDQFLLIISRRPMMLAALFGAFGVLGTWLMTNYRALRVRSEEI